MRRRNASRQSADVAEERFRWLAEQRGFAVLTEVESREIKGHRKKNPDFFVRRDSRLLIVEVKSFGEGTGRWPAPGVGARSISSVLNPIQNRVKEAANQLEPFLGLNVPMLIVLDNHTGRFIDLGEHMLIQLWGRLEVRIPHNKGNINPPPYWAHGKDQLFCFDRKQYISALAVQEAASVSSSLDPRMNVQQMKMRIVHNPFAHVRIPSAWFSHSEDQHWVYDANRHSWGEVRDYSNDHPSYMFTSTADQMDVNDIGKSK